MCRRIISRKFNCGHTDELPDNSQAELCLLGEDCRKFKHVHRVTEKQEGSCADCAANGRPRKRGREHPLTKTWKEKKAMGTEKVYKHPQLCMPARARRVNARAQKDLGAYLEADLEPGMAEDLLRYALGLPEGIDHACLVDIFGKYMGVRTMPGDQARGQFVRMADLKGEGLAKRMEDALERGQ
ncbi:hypothetical protein GGR56DRAFT_655458 [Xylariaceae sp. FL0804]|nr:hypothetical protein GGR56DRAFT_655458 [Xylariaceae sp. FL0804]